MFCRTKRNKFLKGELEKKENIIFTAIEMQISLNSFRITFSVYGIRMRLVFGIVKSFKILRLMPLLQLLKRHLNLISSD